MKNKKLISIVVLGIFIGALVGVFTYLTQGRTPLGTNAPNQKTEMQKTELQKISIIAFGDSLTAGFGLPLSESYPAQLEKALLQVGQGARVINAGVSGETSKGNNERAGFIRSQNPTIVILGIGGNDALRGLPVDELAKNLSNTIEVLRSGDSPPGVVLLAMQAPQNAGIAYKQSFDGLYSNLATKYGLKKIDFIQPEVFLNKELMLADGIHPNKAGYAVLVQKYILPVVARELSDK